VQNYNGFFQVKNMRFRNSVNLSGTVQDTDNSQQQKNSVIHAQDYCYFGNGTNYVCKSMSLYAVVSFYSCSYINGLMQVT